MLCPQCGSSVEYEFAKFCPKCGYSLNTYTATSLRQSYESNMTYTEPLPAPKKGKSSTKLIAVVLAVAIIFGVVLGAAEGLDNNATANEKVDYQSIDSDTYFELKGDFLPEKEIFTMGFNDEGQMTFTLNEDIASKYTYYSWHFFNNDQVASRSTTWFDKYTGETINKSEPVLYYLVPTIGEYDVSVTCYTGTEGNYVKKAEYSGTVGYLGTITKEYTWKYLGEEYQAEVSFTYEEYREFKEKNTNGRHVIKYSNSTSFVTYEEPSIIALAESLRGAYKGSPALDQEFASFVLGFVQICFDYPPYSTGIFEMDGDEYMYGQSEYFAYPLETIFYGMGDCEDTSILLAAIYKALGYETGVVVIPGHAVAAVGLTSYDPGYYSALRYEILSKEVNGLTFYGCETTISTFRDIGLIDISGYNGKPYSEYIDTSIGLQTYGFFIV